MGGDGSPPLRIYRLPFSTEPLLLPPAAPAAAAAAAGSWTTLAGKEMDGRSNRSSCDSTPSYGIEKPQPSACVCVGLCLLLLLLRMLSTTTLK